MKKEVFLISLLIVVAIGLALYFYATNILDNAGGRIMVLVDNIELDRDWKKIDLAKFSFQNKEHNIIFVGFDPPKQLEKQELDNFLQLAVEDFEGGKCSFHPVNPHPILNRGINFKGNGECFTDPNKYKYLWIRSSIKVNAHINWWGSNDEDMKR